MKAITILAAAAIPALAYAQNLCDQYGNQETNGYTLNNNMWGKSYATSGQQCTDVDGASGSGVKWSTNWQWSGGDDNVKSYPNAGKIIATKKLVTQLTNLSTTVNWNYDTQNIRCDVAYDLFTASDPNHSTSSGDYELMIWLGRYGTVYPIGTSQGQVNVAGRSWELFSGPNGNMHVFSFVAPSPVTSFNANVKDFFSYLASNQGFPADNQYLITYQFGTEPFTGGPATLTVSQFFANYN